jgi:hypothetical protein
MRAMWLFAYTGFRCRPFEMEHFEWFGTSRSRPGAWKREIARIGTSYVVSRGHTGSEYVIEADMHRADNSDDQEFARFSPDNCTSANATATRLIECVINYGLWVHYSAWSGWPSH